MDCANYVEYPRSLKIRGKYETAFKFDDFLGIVEREMGIEARNLIEEACDDEISAKNLREVEDANSDLTDKVDSLNSRIEELEREKRVAESASEKWKSEAENWKRKFLDLKGGIDKLKDALMRTD